MNLGMGELIVIFLIVVLIFGANRLPQLGEAVGKGLKNLKRGLNTDDDIDVTPAQPAQPAPPKQVASASSAASAAVDAEVTDAEVVEQNG